MKAFLKRIGLILRGGFLLHFPVIVLLAGAILISLGCDSSSPVRLQSPNWYATGEGPHFVASGDFNHDSNLDLVVANCYSSDLSVFLGAGDGTFNPPLKIKTHRGPTCVQVGYLDGDPHEDMAVTCFRDDSVDILWGNGKGGFELETIKTGSGSAPHAVLIGDFNRDSLNDLAVANGDTDEVLIYPGNGERSFSKPMSLSVGRRPYSLLSSDLNKDRIPDIITGNIESNDISVLLGGEGGVFKPEVRYSTGEGPNILDAGDLDCNDNLDVAVGNCISGSVSILSGDGQGNLEATATLTGNRGVTSLKIADFDRDGRGDLIVLRGNGRVSFYHSRGGLKFKRVLRCSAGGEPCHLLWEDINGDGKNDLVVPNMLTHNLCVFLAE